MCLSRDVKGHFKQGLGLAEKFDLRFFCCTAVAKSAQMKTRVDSAIVV